MVFKKEKELSLPSLPDLSEMQSLNNFRNQKTNSLPSFPSSKLGDKITRDAIKNSVSPDDLKDLEEENFELGYPEEKKEFIPQKFAEFSREENLPKNEIKFTPKPRQIFVKIDNFKQAVELFDDIKLKVAEIEGLMSEIKEVKKREEYELDEWKNEVQILKKKLEEIDRNLFSKLE